MKNAICMICRKPDGIWLDFLSNFIKHDVYILVDDNNGKYHSTHKNINIIQVNEMDCTKNGFKNLTRLKPIKDASGWDKSFFYFATLLNTTYDNVWFIEDDVFFYNEDNLVVINEQYDDDFLSNKPIARTINSNWSHWKHIDIKLPMPHYHTMVCCIRCSKLFISKIREYAIKHRKLCFHEALFPTICTHYDLKYNSPSEFNSISYRKTYELNDIYAKNFYHPVKNVDQHIEYRKSIDYHYKQASFLTEFK